MESVVLDNRALRFVPRYDYTMVCEHLPTGHCTVLQLVAFDSGVPALASVHIPLNLSLKLTVEQMDCSEASGTNAPGAGFRRYKALP